MTNRPNQMEDLSKLVVPMRVAGIEESAGAVRFVINMQDILDAAIPVMAALVGQSDRLQGGAYVEESGNVVIELESGVSTPHNQVVL